MVKTKITLLSFGYLQNYSDKEHTMYFAKLCTLHFVLDNTINNTVPLSRCTRFSTYA